MTGPAAGAMNTADVAGLVRSELTAADIRRQRCGQGFRYFAADGTPLTDRETLARIKALVIPPAWEDTFSAKDFRTWHATVLAAVGLAVSEPAAVSESARKRAVARVVNEVSGYLGNTPAVARASYIDPRVITLYEQGITIARAPSDLG